MPELNGNLNFIKKSREIVLYCEYSGKKDDLEYFEVIHKEGYLSLNFKNKSKTEKKRFLMIIADLINSSECLVTGYDIKKLLKVFLLYDVKLETKFFDIKVAFYLLYPDKKNESFENIYRFCGLKKDKTGENLKDLRILIRISALDIFRKLYCLLEDNELINLFEEVEMPLISVLALMEFKGFKVDINTLKKYRDSLDEKLESVKNSIFNLTKTNLNLDSPKQIAEVLFFDLKLPVLKRTKTGPSTDVDVLKKLSFIHPLPGMLLEYRSFQKIKTGYVDKIYEIAKETGNRVHSEFNQCTASTGRIVSSNPNLQNIPVKTDFGRVLRKIFISEENSYLLSADYSQIELRILAHFSLDKRLVEWFQKDKDVHTHTACMIFNTEKENIDKKMRDLAKTVNFGIVYGISPFGLAKQLDMPVEEAGSFIDKYFDIYPQVKEYINRQSRKIKESDYVKTILGRKRYVGRLSGQNISKKGLSRIILNAPIQGSAADIIKLAMIRINDKLESLKLKSYIILQIHDELILNVYENEYEVLNIVKKETEQAFSLKVPLKIDLKKGKNWFNMESIKL